MTGEKTVLRAANIGIKMQIRERKTAKNSQNLLFKSIIFRRARNGHNRSESSVTGEKTPTPPDNSQLADFEDLSSSILS